MIPGDDGIVHDPPTNGHADRFRPVAPEIDPFSPECLRLPQDFGEQANTRKVITTVACRKPNRHEFVRVRPGDDWRLETAVLVDKSNRDATYLVASSLWQSLLHELRRVCLFLTVNRESDVFMWPVNLPAADGRTNIWNESALEAARLAETEWVRVASNMRAGCYDAHVATGQLPDPEWPERSFIELLGIAFRGRRIDSENHPVLRALRGDE